MATLVVMKDGNLAGLVGIAATGGALGFGTDGKPVAVEPGQPGALLALTPRGEGLKVAALPGAPPFTLNGRKTEGGSLYEGDLLELGSWSIQLDPRVRTVQAAEEGASARLFEVVARAARGAEAGEILRELLDEAVQRFEAERGFVLYRRRARDPLEPVAGVGFAEGELDQARASGTALTQALEAGHPILVGDASSELQGAESVQVQGIRSILCAPLGDHGAFYLDSRAGTRAYASTDLELFTTFAGYARLALELFLESDELRRKAARSEAGPAPGTGPSLVVGPSPEMRRLATELDQVAGEEVTVLVTGETGTGKEVLAREVHARSPRRDGPFVAVNCMAYAREVLESELFGHEKGAFTGADARRLGRFELADGGTLFLDEVGELSPEIQVKLLRVLQERVIERVGGRQPVPVDIRVVAATNRDLPAMVQEGSFREDLYYRLNVFTLTPPPLRARLDDIPALAAHLVEVLNRRLGKSIEGLDDDALAAMREHDWPGNVRELGNVIERAMVLTRKPTLGPESLPFGAGARAPAASPGSGGDFLAGLPDGLPAAREEFERLFILRALEKEGGNVAAAARRLEIPRSTIYRKAEQFGVDLKNL